MDKLLRIGMVGLDTSHCPAFTGLLNDETHAYHIPGARVVGAYPGGSELFSLSRDRVAGFTAQLQDDFGVKICPSIPDLVKDVDALFLESVDGRQHLAQFAQMTVGKPVYIDKPLATTTDDARKIIELARETQTPITSCSSLRYASGIADLVGAGQRSCPVKPSVLPPSSRITRGCSGTASTAPRCSLRRWGPVAARSGVSNTRTPMSSSARGTMGAPVWCAAPASQRARSAAWCTRTPVPGARWPAAGRPSTLCCCSS